MTPEAEKNLETILHSSSYKLAERDTDFLARYELRPVRMQLELLKPEVALSEHKIISTIVMFGSAQIVDRPDAELRLEAARTAAAAKPNNKRFARELHRAQKLLDKCNYYDAAREFARLVSVDNQTCDRCEFVMATGGGPGLMEAANRGAFDAGAKSVGFNIALPAEQTPNPYITPDLCFQFHYFALRKMHFLLRAKALIAFPGGFGTMDELFETLTLRQTRRMQSIPVILFGSDYWNRVIDFQYLADEGVIQDDHLELLSFADTPQDAWEIIVKFYQRPVE